MRKARLYVIAFVVLATSFGIPAQVSASPRFPTTLEAARTLVHTIAPGHSATISVPMPWRANMIGASFLDRSNSQRGISIDARAHTDAGWSAWEDLGTNDNGPPESAAARANPRVSTEPLWVGTADKVEVRISVATGADVVRDFRVHLINTLGDAKPRNILQRFWSAAGNFFTSHATIAAEPAQALTTVPPFISRVRWGADPSKLNLPCPGIADTLKMAFIHHTDTTNSYSKGDSSGIVRAIFRYHTDTRGYCDIAYNFLIDRYGQIFEGRMGGIANNVIGAHTGGYNTGSVGIAMIGTFTSAKPTYAMLISLNKLLAWRLDVGHVPPVGTVVMTTGSGNDHHPKGSLVKFNRIAGHRDASYTSCPGKYLYGDLSWIRSHVAAMGLPKIYTPTLSTANLRPDGDTHDELTRFTASFSASVNWTLSFADPSGVVQRTFTGTGSALSQYWSGMKEDGSLVSTGVYHWTLTAVDGTGHSATPATGVLNIVTSHPNGTILLDLSGRFILEGGAIRPVDAITYASNFGTRWAVSTGPGERARYASGSPLDLRNGTLFVGPDGEHYIWSDGALHHFKKNPLDTWAGLHYSATAAISVSVDYLAGLQNGPDINDITTHPDGTLITTGGTTPTYYVIDAGKRRPVSALARASWYRTNEATPLVAGDLALTTGTAFPVHDGTFIKATDGGAPWLVSDGMKRRFASSWFATLMGYSTSMMFTATAADINAIPTGARIG